jgi:hypothetical protein
MRLIVTAAVGAVAAVPALTCADLSPAITQAVSDLKTQDANEQEAWVSGGDGADLQTLISDTASASLAEPIRPQRRDPSPAVIRPAPG